MTVLRKSLWGVMAVLLTFACDPNDSDYQVSEEVMTPEYVAGAMRSSENFDEDVEKRIYERYLSFSHEEMSAYIEASFQLDIDDGKDLDFAKTSLQFMHEVNDRIFEQTGKSYTSAGLDVLESVYSQVMANPIYAKYQQIDNVDLNDSEDANGRTNGPCTSWTRSGTIRYTPNRIEPTVGVEYKWDVTNVGDTDCDLMFRTPTYSSNLWARKILGTTFRASNTLTYNGSDRHNWKQYNNAWGKRSEFIIGRGRVWRFYGFGNASTFASEVRIEIG